MQFELGADSALQGGASKGETQNPTVGYVTTGANIGGGVTVAVANLATTTGLVMPVTFRYSAAGAPGEFRSLTLDVNGVEYSSLAFPTTADDDTYNTVTFGIPVQAGSNDLLVQIKDDFDTGPIHLDEIRYNPCPVSVNTSPTVEEIPDTLVLADADAEINFQVDDAETANLSVQVLGWPGAGTPVVNGTDVTVTGPPIPEGETYLVTVIVTDDDPVSPRSTSTKFELQSELYRRSEDFGNLVITEVRFKGGVFFEATEFIEVMNTSYTDDFSLDRLVIRDYNLKADGGPDDGLDVTAELLASDELTSQSSRLGPRQRAILWVVAPGALPNLPGVLQFDLMESGFARLGNGGDDVWILDKDGDEIIAYAAFGVRDPGTELKTAPAVRLGVWDGSSEAALGNIDNGRSISLATVDADGAHLSDCWEHTQPDDGSTRPAPCSLTTAPTWDTDAGDAVSSPGLPNHPPN